MATPDRQIDPDYFYEKDVLVDEVKFCGCGAKLFDVETMCDDCLCELDDPA